MNAIVEKVTPLLPAKMPNVVTAPQYFPPLFIAIEKKKREINEILTHLFLGILSKDELQIISSHLLQSKLSKRH